MEWRNDILSFSGFGYGMTKERVTGPCECHLEVHDHSDNFGDENELEEDQLGKSEDELDKEKNEESGKDKKRKDLLDFYLRSMSDSAIDKENAKRIDKIVKERQFVENMASLQVASHKKSETKSDEEVDEEIPISQMIESCENSMIELKLSEVENLHRVFQDDSLPDDWKSPNRNFSSIPTVGVCDNDDAIQTEDDIERVLKSHTFDPMDERKIENEYFKDVEQAERKLNQLLTLKWKWERMHREGEIVNRSFLRPAKQENPWKHMTDAGQPVELSQNSLPISKSNKLKGCVIC